MYAPKALEAFLAMTGLKSSIDMYAATNSTVSAFIRSFPTAPNSTRRSKNFMSAIICLHIRSSPNQTEGGREGGGEGEGERARGGEGERERGREGERERGEGEEVVLLGEKGREGERERENLT